MQHASVHSHRCDVETLASETQAAVSHCTVCILIPRSVHDQSVRVRPHKGKRARATDQCIIPCVTAALNHRMRSLLPRKYSQWKHCKVNVDVAQMRHRREHGGTCRGDLLCKAEQARSWLSVSHDGFERGDRKHATTTAVANRLYHACGGTKLDRIAKRCACAVHLEHMVVVVSTCVSECRLKHLLLAWSMWRGESARSAILVHR